MQAFRDVRGRRFLRAFSPVRSDVPVVAERIADAGFAVTVVLVDGLLHGPGAGA